MLQELGLEDDADELMMPVNDDEFNDLEYRYREFQVRCKYGYT